MTLAAINPGDARSLEKAVGAYRWVGEAHNKGLDDFRRHLQQRRTGQHLCDVIADFSTRPERLPRGKEHAASSLRATSMRRAFRESAVCSGYPSAALASNASSASAGAIAPQEPSPIAASLAVRIEEAVENAESSSDLSVAVNAILAETVSLLPEEREALFAVASVAQSSYEYWRDHLDVLATEVGQVYGDCGNYYGNLGYDSDEARSRCLMGDYRETGAPRLRQLPSAPMVLAGAVLPRCSDGGAGMKLRFRSVGRTDVKGATAGAFGGIPGGPAGIVGGALGGGLGVSAAEAVGYAWNIWWCLMR